MWLSPPARAGIVKLSGAQIALLGAPLPVPSPGTSFRTQQGVGSILSLRQRAWAYVKLHVCIQTCEVSLCVYSVVLYCWRCSFYRMILWRRNWPLYCCKNLCSRSSCCWLATFLCNALTLPQCVKQSELVPNVCSPVSEKKSLFGPPKEHYPPILSTGDSVAPSSYQQTLCSLLIYEFVQYNNNNVFFRSGIGTCFFLYCVSVGSTPL